MESTGGASFMRNRRLESFLDTDSGKCAREALKFPGDKFVQNTSSDVYVDDDGWISELVSAVRIVLCFLTMMVTTVIWALVMLLLLPFPYERIRQGNIYGHVTGRLMFSGSAFWKRLSTDMWILGNPIKIEGGEFSNERAVYISNHASPIDTFLIMWLTPTGTVGVAKKEIIFYPLIGQLYVLANHLRIDRSNPSMAIRSIIEVAKAVSKNNLSIIIFPEGTRSENGRLLPFKKGFVHLAIQSQLPIVPMVMTGTHLAWRKGSLHVRPTPITVKFLPPISTDNWTAEKIDDYIKMVHDIYVKNLPEAQRPCAEQGSENGSSS